MTGRTFVAPQEFLQKAPHIALIGAGGTGSDMAVRLAKLHAQLRALDHPGLQVTIYDGDSVSASNIGRQHFPPSAIGLNKAVMLTHSLNLAYGLAWKCVPLNFEVKTAVTFDLVVSCTDLAQFRAALGEHWKKRKLGTMWLDTGNGRDRGQVVLGHLGTPMENGARRLPNVLDLYPGLARMREADRDEPSCSAAEAMRRQAWPVNQAAAMLAAEMLWTLFSSGALSYHGAHFQLAPFRTTPLYIDPVAWSFYGYNTKDWG